MTLFGIVLFAILWYPCFSFCKAIPLTKPLIQVRGGQVDSSSTSTPSLKTASNPSFIETTYVPLPSNDDSKQKRKQWWSFLKIFTSTESFLQVFLKVVVEDADIRTLLAKSLSYFFWGFLILSILGTFGFDTKPLLSLVSVAGITLGFGLKDLLASSFSGLLLLFTRPFERDSIITVNGYTGRVIGMDVRFVRLQSLQDKRVEYVLPVSSLHNSPIIIERPL